MAARAIRRSLGAAALLVLLLAAGVGGSARADEPATACGAAASPTVAAVVGSVANSIYSGELGGGEVATDAKIVSSSAPLLDALAAGNQHAIYRATSKLVYHPFWHIVRLRVLDPNGVVLADVGGPYVIAPVTGVLRQGTTVVGSYVMSVQDDVGFTRLETHAAGAPIAIYYAGKRVAERGASLPRRPPTTPTLALGGVTYSVVTETYSAFPTGTLEAVMLVPPVSAAAAEQPCVAVRASVVGRVARLLATRFHPLDASYMKFVEVVHKDTGAIVIVRIGPRALPGSQVLGPTTIPISGPVDYLGRAYWVYSFAPTPPARIYLLVGEPATPAPGS